MRRFLMLIVLLVGLAAMAAFYIASQLGTIAKTQIETQGSAATETAVTVGGVDVAGLLGGAVSVSNIAVANPKGFSPGPAIQLASIALKIDPASLFAEGPIVINEIVLKSPSVSFESTGASSNLKTLQQTIQRNTASGGDTGGGRKIVIDKITIDDGLIAITHPALSGRALATRLPPVTLNDIGRESGGATAAQATQQVLAAVTESAIRAAVEALAKESIGVGDISPGGVLDRLKTIGR